MVHTRSTRTQGHGAEAVGHAEAGGAEAGRLAAAEGPEGDLRGEGEREAARGWDADEGEPRDGDAPGERRGRGGAMQAASEMPEAPHLRGGGRKP